jgi:hypothetical protein
MPFGIPLFFVWKRKSALIQVGAQDVHKKGDGHKRNPQDKRPPGHDVVVSGFALERRSDAGPAGHCVTLARDENKGGKQERNDHADSDKDFVKSIQD